MYTYIIYIVYLPTWKPYTSTIHVSINLPFPWIRYGSTGWGRRGWEAKFDIDFNRLALQISVRKKVRVDERNVIPSLLVSGSVNQVRIPFFV